MSQHQNNSETEQELSSHTECPIPEACELSPEMSSTMRHFSVRHNCLYAEAKKQLVDKIVHKVMDNAAPRIMALLEEELERRAAEKDEEDDEESRRTTMDTEVSPKV
ncbi:hypothetical protein QBC32DRAFT_219629 [Pseudoneurospora amorphoporcata]|uniref:Uncharacterized protein n=1 Tax=Pseudoneurospora amorphoporcata TaxID=241081 RepID=A0AAN6SDD9_9PEZI|nr:hypothetical protein QBC32DRAFT_219629 [Pseudoneurospora amorphoporcata]